MQVQYVCIVFYMCLLHIGIQPCPVYAGNFPKCTVVRWEFPQTYIQIKVMYLNDCLLDKLSVQCLHM